MHQQHAHYGARKLMSFGSDMDSGVIEGVLNADSGVCSFNESKITQVVHFHHR